MKPKNALSIIVLPTIVAGYILYHPGIAFAKTSLSTTLPPTDFHQSGTFIVEPAHTCVGFDIGHLGLSRVQGRFDVLTGSVQIDLKDMDRSSVEVTIQTNSVNTHVAPRDTDLRSPNFFDVSKFPEMVFKSTNIRRKGKRYVAEGNLTLKGVSKRIAITFKQYGPIKDPWGNNRIGVVAEPITINRSDFGMTYDADTVSNDVVIRLSLEATEEIPAQK